MRYILQMGNEIQRGLVTCLKSPRRTVVELRIEPRSPDPRLLHVITIVYHEYKAADLHNAVQ